MSKAINIILDEKDPTSPVFVEIENDNGASISIGKRSAYVYGLTKLRITINDIYTMDDANSTKQRVAVDEKPVCKMTHDKHAWLKTEDGFVCCDCGLFTTEL